MTFILDTDISIEILRGNPRIISKIETLKEDTLISTSMITVAELLYGAYLSNKKEQRITEVKDFISDIEVLNLDLLSTEIYGRLKSTLKLTGGIVADNDLFIASIAIRNNSILVTHNLKHFSRISELTIEDWLAV